jgi:uncharacterized protein (TIGR02145 family)
MLQKHKLLNILMVAFASTLLIFIACQKDENDNPTTEDPTNGEIINWGDGVTDIDGNNYSSVIIGNQEWMAENLKTMTYSDGTPIDLVENDTDWLNNTTAAYCWYDNDQAQYAETYGALYNWYTVNTGNLCPEGWHVPTDEEWNILEMELGMSQGEVEHTSWRGSNEGSKLAGNAALWSDGALENDSEFGSIGFTALPAGFRNSTGAFDIIGICGVWWSATEANTDFALYRCLYYTSTGVMRNTYHKEDGFSVRCLKD